MPTEQKQRCGHHLREGWRCQRTARHTGWHEASQGRSRARWLSERSYEIETPTRRP